jgi:hypothetical protein
MPRRPSKSSQDKRKTHRIEPYLASCRVIVGRRRLHGYVTNLSPRGARVYCDEKPPKIGQKVVLEIRFKERTAATRVPAEARWVRTASDPSAMHSFGVSFKGIPVRAKAAVEAVLQEFRRRAAMLLDLAG